MDTFAVRTYFNEHPDGVEIEMVDGTVYQVPHRDYVWFTPAFGREEKRIGRLATSFWMHDPKREETKLVNALLVKSLSPWRPGTNGSHGQKRRKAR